MNGLPIYKQVAAVAQAQKGGKVAFALLRARIATSDTSLCRALRSLIDGGYMIRVKNTRGRYALTDKGKQTEPVNIIDRRVIQHRANAETGGIREMWWRHLRIKKIASADDAIPLLVEVGKVTPHLYQDVNRYCIALEAAGYIAKQKGQTTKVLRRIKWLMVRDTGAHSPKMSRDRQTLVDRNNGATWKL